MGRVIRATGRRVEAVEVDGSARARSLVEVAERRAAAIIDEARAEADRLRDEAGAEMLRAALAQDADARRAVDELLARREDELVALALGVGAHLARGALADEPSRVLALVDDALAKLPSTTELRILVSPEDASTLDDPRVRIDETLGRGDVVVESRIGRVDARFATRLAAVERAIRDDG